MSDNNDRWYFAYGSNLWSEQMERRTGPIRDARRCRLDGYRLAFDKRGSTRSPVFANIVEERDAVVWGVAYLCNDEAIEQMNRFEGLAKGHYVHANVRVVIDSGEVLDALTYVAGPGQVCDPGAPSAQYLNLILDGAAHHQLPTEYVDSIRELAHG